MEDIRESKIEKLIFNNSKSKETLALVGFLLLSISWAFPNEYNEFIGFFNGKYYDNYLSILLTTIFLGFFLLSVLTLFFSVIFTVYYAIIDILDKKAAVFKEWLLGEHNNVHRFFLGSKHAVLKVFTWFWVIILYLFIFNTNQIIDYTLGFYYLLIELWPIKLYGILFFLYIIVMFYTLYNLILEVIYKFLYFSYTERKE